VTGLVIYLWQFNAMKKFARKMRQTADKENDFPEFTRNDLDFLEKVQWWPYLWTLPIMLPRFILGWGAWAI